MAVYNKNTGIATDYVDLITKLRDFLLIQGFALELYDDNIIGGTNFGKKLHMSKNSVYYNFATSLNNSTTGPSSYTMNNISEIASNCSLTFNPSSDWFSNNAEPDIVRAEYKPNSTFWFYVNDKNIIIIIRYAINKYTMLNVGEANSLTVDKVVFQSSTCTNIVSSGQLTKIPLFKIQKTSYYIASTYFRESNSKLSNNHFNTNTSQVPSFNVDTSGNNGFVNRSDNLFNGTSILMPIKYYTRITSPVSSAFYQPTFTLKEVFLINFKNHTNEQNLNVGTNSYDVFPFYQKESPHIYSNTQNFGMGIAIKIAE